MIPELKPSLEQPRNTVPLTLPQIDVGGNGSVRLGMHTDTIGNFLRTLNGLSQTTKEGLRVEGRVLTPAQWVRLKEHPLYRFYLEGRLQRVALEKGRPTLSYLIPDDLGFSWAEVIKQSRQIFSPRTLAQELGYGVGYYDAETLLAVWREGTGHNIFLPLFGGSNELLLGSDSIPQERLEVLAQEISERLGRLDVEYLLKGISSKTIAANMLSGFNAFPVNRTPLDRKFFIDFGRTKIGDQFKKQSLKDGYNIIISFYNLSDKLSN